ncbi:MAG TPA: SUMF1/EgtB/PvdO family nonheme iron enzyme [Anaerolineaceae bacterium]|nr:SUMF1/EgtB/PvdO family nonheme iron enzyme [Anaerolineaceae bacterium]
MGFNLDSWKAQIADYFKSRAPRIKQAGANTLYGLLAVGALLPAISAYHGGEIAPVVIVLSDLLGSVGSNLIANLIQKWKDKTEEQIAHEVLGAAQQDASLQETLDGLLEKLEVVSSAQQALSEADKQWFVETLQAELKRINSSITLNTEGGAVVMGNVKQGPGSTFVGRDQILIQKLTQLNFNLHGSTESITLDLGDGQIVNLTRSQAAEVFLRSYFGALSARCQDLPLGRVHPRFAQSATKGSVSLETVYTDLDVVRPPREKDLDIRHLGLKLERADGGKRQQLMKIIADTQLHHFVLLGGAGSGKTTFVNYLTFALAQAASGQPAPELPKALQGLLPVRIILRHIAASIPVNAACGEPEMIWKALRKDMETLLGELGAAQLFPVFQQRILHQGAMILLDGLDEVPEAGQRRKCLLEAIQSWLKCFNGVQPRVLLTARPYAYADPAWQLPDFEMLSLAPFDEEQIGNFVDHWYQAARPAIGWDADTAAGRGSLLKQAIQQRSYLADLASRPLLLTLTAAIDTGGGKLPEDRAELYEEAVNLLLLRWQRGSEILDADGKTISDDQITRVQAIPEAQKRRALEKLAYQVHERQGQAQSRSSDSADIPATDIYAVFNPLLPDDINARVLLGFLENRAGLLIGRSEEVYTFLHRSFQEYLAGCYLVSSDDFAARMKKLLASDRDWWREVCLLAVGKAGQNMPFALGILDEFVPGKPDEEVKITDEQQRLAALTGTALLELRVPERAAESEKALLVQTRTTRWLVNILQTGCLPAQERAEAGNILARLGDPRFRSDAFYLPDEPLLGFVHIPAGRFIMGSDKKKDSQADDDETPQHEVELGEFYLARYPVTVAQFKAFVEASSYEPDDPDSLNGFPNHPVVNVTWYDAIAYCDWLTTQLLYLHDLPSELSWGWRVALPSEAEWERAARGTHGRIYPWGDKFDHNRANTGETRIGGTSAVGCFPSGPSPEGLLDVSGNIFEWTRSLSAKYPYPAPGPRRTDRELVTSENKEMVVVRGGSWDYVSRYARCAYRYGGSPDLRDVDFGFRVSLSPL